ncbi:sugar kinase [Amorphus orientalis]|uniref:2-dehydro-3-deoxygluconokinase n=1 Tax=Amorphus orientalis TaxID=649198 RepID=A0AAE3VM11_9HYPH|nr:sugar kinase [Amorphus orientalis]MDQ0314528.1 2-dehydro-3-deoxygluconokinase [Amorphus orientalis]
MPDLVCLGEALLEFSSQQRDGQTFYLQGYGGDTSNCAIAAARQGASVGYVTAVGDDAFGREFLDLWKREGVETGGVIVDPDAPTGIYFITYANGEHEFSYRRVGSAASRMTPQSVPLDIVRQAKILHVSGISQAISDTACDAVFAAMTAARQAGVQVSYDTNLRLKLWPIERARAVIHAGMAMADIALPGLEDARQLTGLEDPDAIVDFYLALGPKVVALTMGSAGTMVATSDLRETVPVHKVDHVDATAAGDMFDGAFLARLMAGDDVVTAVTYANTAAALSTLGYGAVAPMPTAEAVRKALAEKAT